MRTKVMCSALTLAACAATVPMIGAETLVVLNKSEATASLVDLGSGKTLATLPTGNGPHEVAVSPDGRLALGADYGVRGAPGSSLTLIDVPAAKVLKTIDLGEYRRPHGVQWLEDGRHAVVTAEANRSLLIVDVETGKVAAAIETGQEVSHMVAVTPDATRAFVANIGSGTVTAIDLANRKVLAQIVTGPGAEGIDVTPDGREVWVTNREEDTLAIVSVERLEVVAKLDSPSFPIRARFTPDGKHVLVSRARSGDLGVFDVAGRQLSRTISMDLSAVDAEDRLFGDSFGRSSVPIGIVVTPDGRRAFVAHSNADVISIVDLEEWKVVGTLTAGKEPDGMAYSALTVAAARQSK
jgi:YVTN family beta-propeller protein